MKKLILGAVLLFLCTRIVAQRISIQEYIDTYKDLAIREMKRMGVPASITLAQGILETENGNSALVKKSNNHFGIKCKNSWSGGSVSHDDDAIGECFRKYGSAEESYRDHSNFLRGSERYAFLFKLAPTDYKGWAHGLKKAGYATNPKYPEILIRHIEEYNLNQYTLDGNSEVPLFDPSVHEDDKEIKQPGTVSSDGSTGIHDKSQFNGLKAVFAPTGTSLLAIATQFDISLSKLLEYNDLENDGLLQEESWIFLEKKRKEGKRDSYTTTAEMSVYEISQANGIQLSYLLEYNGLQKNDRVKAGKLIRLKALDEVKEAVADSQKGRIHKVQAKEGLYSISKKYHVTIAELKEWNQLDSDDLHIGQELIISK